MPELIALRRNEPIFDAKGFGTLRFNEYIEELTKQVNTSTNEMEETGTQLSAQQQIISQLAELIKKQDVIVVTTSDITAKPFETIICNNIGVISVTLEVNALKGDIINIKRKNAPIDVIGLIDGKTNMRINVKNYSMKLVYDGTEWSEV